MTIAIRLIAGIGIFAVLGYLILAFWAMLAYAKMADKKIEELTNEATNA